MGKINFYSQDIDFKLKEEKTFIKWIKETVKSESKKIKAINYIFVDDNALHKINIDHLDHDTLTDIITFPYGYAPIETDIYISIDRVKDNAQTHKVSFDQELKRVIIHGVLHMIGYGDKTKEEARIMRQKEDDYITVFA